MKNPVEKLNELKDKGFEKVGNFCKYVGSNIENATKPIREHAMALWERMKDKIQGKGELASER